MPDVNTTPDSGLPEPKTDFATLQRFGKQHNLDFIPSQWLSYHLLTLKKGGEGVSSLSGDVAAIFQFDDEGCFINVVLICEQCNKDMA
jgi:hypothetical protein